MSGELKEKSIFCFNAKLKRVGKDEYFQVPFKVLAERDYIAKAMLQDWLKDPKQTGYKYEECVGLVQQASDFVIVGDKSERGIESYTREINRVLGDKDTVWLKETDLSKVRNILSEIDNKFGKKQIESNDTDNKTILKALQFVKKYCENGDCSQCQFGKIFDCVPSGGEASVPCNWIIEENKE